jgi:O-antigen biosynthesis protein
MTEEALEQVNSRKYWEHRFSSNWNSHNGPAQSKYFATLALAVISKELGEEIRNFKFSIMDWGCAEGDGTHEIQLAFPRSNVLGVDFSKVAIEKAKQKYPNTRFNTFNYLNVFKSLFNFKTFDVIFSSNVFEHFKDPFHETRNIIRRARKYLILLVPFKEEALHPEHYFRFDEYSIPHSLSGGFHLISSTEIDCSKDPQGLWGGSQIILIYKR